MKTANTLSTLLVSGAMALSPVAALGDPRVDAARAAANEARAERGRPALYDNYEQQPRPVSAQSPNFYKVAAVPAPLPLPIPPNSPHLKGMQDSLGRLFYELLQKKSPNSDRGGGWNNPHDDSIELVRKANFILGMNYETPARQCTPNGFEAQMQYIREGWTNPKIREELAEFGLDKIRTEEQLRRYISEQYCYEVCTEDFDNMPFEMDEIINGLRSILTRIWGIGNPMVEKYITRSMENGIAPPSSVKRRALNYLQKVQQGKDLHCPGDM